MPDDSTFESEFRDIEIMLRELDTTDLELETPPDSIWHGITEQLALDDRTPVGGGATVMAAPFGRRRSWMVPLSAAAAVILVVAVGVFAVTNSPSSTEPASTELASTELASADLAFAPGFDPAGEDAAASAVLVDDDGNEFIRIDDDELPFDAENDASLELWLIEADADGNVIDLVSLGAIDPDGDRTFAVPPGYDPSVFTVVDISIEPHDGDETHSGRSILRGALA